VSPRPKVLVALASTPALLAACQPNLDDTVSIVSSPTLLAISADPPEAPPASDVTYTALLAPGGADAAAPALVWDYCSARNPLSNLGPVNNLCIQPGSSSLSRFGVGTGASGDIPMLACSSFGPNAPAGVDGGPGGQPVSPDFTGGYYQPVSAFLPRKGAATASVYFMRIACGFAGADEAAQGTLTARYHPNHNPAVGSLAANGMTLVPMGASGSEATSASPGARLALTVSWPTCPLVDVCGDDVCGADESATTCPVDCAPPKGPKGCAGAERYVNLDLATQTVVDQREGIDVAWYATGGAFELDRTGREGTDDATTSDNGWTAPQAPAAITMWVIVRDDRGGVGWADYAIRVR